MGTIANRKAVGPLRTDRHLDLLNGIHHQKAQLPVEHIQGQGRIETRTRHEGMLAVGTLRQFHAKPVGSQAVVVQVGQGLNGLLPIGDHQAPGFKLVKLVPKGKGRLRISHQPPLEK